MQGAEPPQKEHSHTIGGGASREPLLATTTLTPTEGVAIPLGQFGEFGVSNDFGLLRLTVPVQFEKEMLVRLCDVIEMGPERTLADGGGTVTQVWVRLHKGMRRSYSLGVLGAVGVEAV